MRQIDAKLPARLRQIDAKLPARIPENFILNDNASWPPTIDQTRRQKCPVLLVSSLTKMSC
jgi:hypothetical protein